MNYDALRHFADSWGLLFMVLVFAGLIGWALRPAARPLHRDAAYSIFDEDHHG
jgi:cytochrome c oxidase cbb3-type subunit IV